MSVDQSFADLMSRLQRGDDASARQLFERYQRRLLELARHHLDRRVARKEDPEDVLQSVFKSFFFRYRAGQFELGNWRELWGLLSVITLRKCVNRIEYFRAGCRDVQREVSFDQPAPEGDAALAMLDREPSPVEAVTLAETLEQLLRDYDPLDRQVIELTLQGCTIQQVGAQLGRAERTVRRLRKRFKSRLERMRAGDLAESAAEED